jgi:hypothetical protein
MHGLDLADIRDPKQRVAVQHLSSTNENGIFGSGDTSQRVVGHLEVEDGVGGDAPPAISRRAPFLLGYTSFVTRTAVPYATISW